MRRTTQHRGGGGHRWLLIVLAGTIGSTLQLEQARAEVPARKDVDWADSGVTYTELNTPSTAASAAPFITVSRHILNDPEGRSWHTHTWRWSAGQWVKVVVNTKLEQNPWTTADARPAANGAALVHAWRDAGDVVWQPMDPTDGSLGAFEFFPMPYENYPVGLAVQTDGNPVFSFRDGAGDMQAARWTGNGIGLGTNLPLCANLYAPLDLNIKDLFRVVCDTSNGFASDILIYEEDSSGAVNQTVVFGAGDAFAWQSPDLAMVGDEAVVAAYYDDGALGREVQVRWQVNGVFQPAVRFLKIGGGYVSHAVDARVDAAGGLVIGVIVQTTSRVYYVEYANGVLAAPRRVDLFPQAGTDTCGINAPDFYIHNGDVLLPNDDDVWFNWQIAQEGVNAGEGIAANRFTGLRRSDSPNTVTTLDQNTSNTASLALGEEGDDWTCFFDTDPGLPAPAKALFVRRRDEPPLQVESDTGQPADPYSRGCDVGVDGQGDLHVIWGNAQQNSLRYRRMTSVGWDPVEALADVNGNVPATGHLALSVEQGTGNRVAFIYRRPVGANHRVCILEKTVGPFSSTCLPQDVSQPYPDITTYGPGGSVYAVIYGAGTSAAPQVRVAISSGVGQWADELLNAQMGFDFAIDARDDVNGNSRVMAAWYAPLGGARVMVAERVGVGSWAGGTVENVRGEFVDLKLSPDLDSEATITYRRDNGAGPDMLRLATWQVFANGRGVADATPQPGRVLCDLSESDRGTSLELDRFGNPRILHRHLDVSTPTLNFVTRP